MKESIVILAGGGPAPGINTVISTVAKTFLKDAQLPVSRMPQYQTAMSNSTVAEVQLWSWQA